MHGNRHGTTTRARPSCVPAPKPCLLLLQIFFRLPGAYACVWRCRYTKNSTEFPFSLWLYQKYFPIDRIGFGVWPTQFSTESPASDAFVASRMDAFERYA